MKEIYLISEFVFEGDLNKLKGDFEKIIDSHPRKHEFYNTEASLFWITRGGIDYFDSLNSNFLGKGNESGIPSMETDHFVNNFYRLSNTLNYLSTLWQITLNEIKGWDLLEDVRTFIVHSGEQLTQIKSIEFNDYKDAQLGRIMLISESIDSELTKKDNYDYCIKIWTDKHDTSKSRQENEVDHDSRKENFRDINIYLNAKDVRNIILSRIALLISKVSGSEPSLKKIKPLPEAVKHQVIDNCDFDKLEKLIKNKNRGQYSIENEEAYWGGFGLKRLYEYVSNYSRDDSVIRLEIEKIISKRLEDFWISYNDETIPDDKVPSLDIRDVFEEYTPKYKLKNYLEGEKLFINIAPMFNKKDEQQSTDVDYLYKFIYEVQEVLGRCLRLENDVNGVVCDYFVKSVENFMTETNKESKNKM
ncbi:hypothetical protein PT085_02945 [Erysipelothrix rhusiopathiae]|nr:hypothetical protein [Erysipelothrix rhusiopathiae]